MMHSLNLDLRALELTKVHAIWYIAQFPVAGSKQSKQVKTLNSTFSVVGNAD